MRKPFSKARMEGEETREQERERERGKNESTLMRLLMCTATAWNICDKKKNSMEAQGEGLG